MKLKNAKFLGLKAIKFLMTPLYRHTALIKIEGGLGSQLIGAFSYYFFSSTSEYSKVLVDDSYFDITDPSKSSDLSFWNWELDRYGLQRLNFSRPRGISKVVCKFLKPIEFKADVDFWYFVKSNLKSKFPIDRKSVNVFLENSQVLSDYGCLHIRRGDYVRVASKLISHEEYLSLLAKITDCLPVQMIVFSDELILEEWKVKYRHSLGEKTIFITDDSLEPGLIHDVMRLSKVLITANSTFSFTAGILADSNSVVYSPINFYGPEQSNMENNFRTAGRFVVSF